MVTTSKPVGVADLTSAEAGPATAKTKASGTKPLISIARPSDSGGSRHPFEQVVAFMLMRFDACEPAAQVLVVLQYRHAFRPQREHRELRREQQIGEAERVSCQPGMTIEQTSDLGDADPRVGDSLDDRVFIDRPIEARGDDAIAGD